MLDERFEDIVYFVEANSFEQLALWQTHHKGVVESQYKDEVFHKVPWKDESSGSVITVGSIGGRPICVSFFWSKIFGKRVCFYNPTSALVDWTMVEAYIKKICPDVPMCDASNFRRCLHHILGLLSLDKTHHEAIRCRQ